MLKINNNIKFKNKISGITLVALVVTIVVLLILAGITINMLFSNNGIIKQAQDAKNMWENAEKTDQEGMKNLADQMDGLLGKDISSLGKLIATNDYVAQNTTVTDKNGESLTVPKDFKVTADSNEVKKGVVIEDKQGNQFVWVPVTDVTTMYETQGGEKVGKLYNFSTTGYTARAYPGKNTGYREPDILTDTSYGDASTTAGRGISQLKDVVGLTGATDNDILNTWSTQLQSEFNEMIASVEKYKGFYIGRYETGNLAANTTTIPVVKKGQTAIGSVNWYYMYQNSKKIAENNTAVTSSMIWGSQWDRTLQWLVESGSKTYAELSDSTSWGNYNNSTGAAATNSGSKQPSGNNEAWKANNIYDLAGNVFDWTIEASFTYGRVSRRRLL